MLARVSLLSGSNECLANSSNNSMLARVSLLSGSIVSLTNVSLIAVITVC